MKKRVLIISSVFKPEPVVSARISEDIANSLSDDFDVVVFSPYPSRPKGIDFSDVKLTGTKYKRVIADSFIYPDSKFIGRMRESFSFGWETYKYLKLNRKEFSVIYANTKPLFAIYFTLLASKKFGIPLVLHIQDVYPESMFGRIGKGRFLFKSFLLFDRIFFRYAKKILVISEKMKEYIVQTRHIDYKNIDVVRNWQGDLIPQFSSDDNHEIFTYMFVGSISPAAGVKFLIDSFIDAGIHDCRLVIAGDGTQKKECIELVEKRGANNVLFTSVGPDQVLELQNKADVLLLPLKKGVGKTASPSKLSAYMMSGKPIIASVDTDCDTDFVIKKANCGIVVDSENKEQMIDAMKKILLMKENNRLTMGRNAYDFAIKYMSKDYNLAIVKNIIQTSMK